MTKYYSEFDTKPTVSDTLLDPNGDVVDLTSASVYFIARLSSEKLPRIDGSATVVTASAGEVAYTLTATDLALYGTYEYQWQVVDGSGKRFSVPTASKGSIVLYDAVGYGGLTSTHASGTIAVTQATLDTQGVALGQVPPSATVYAFLGNQPVAKASATSSGNFTFTLVDNLTYSIQASYPGYTFTSRTVST